MLVPYAPIKREYLFCQFSKTKRKTWKKGYTQVLLYYIFYTWKCCEENYGELKGIYAMGECDGGWRGEL